MEHGILVVEAVLMVTLMLTPCVMFLIYGWADRKRDILIGLDSREQIAIRLFFDKFHPDFLKKESLDPRVRFERFYDQQFGRRTFAAPLIILLATTAVVFTQCVEWLTTISALSDPWNDPRVVALFAMMGAFLWVCRDQITRSWFSDLSPGDLYWASYRFAFSVPAAYAVSQMFKTEVGFAIAFFLGAFPTDTLFSIFRRLARRQMNLGEENGDKESELQKLSGVDYRKAERFAAEGITTVMQLAYADPVRLTIRTNLGYSYIADCISQALLWIYTSKDFEKWQWLGLRGAFEAINLTNDLADKDPMVINEARELVSVVATTTTLHPVAVSKILDEVANDPYAQFIYNSWMPVR